MSRLFQYQAAAEPVLVPASVVVPDFGWFVQGPDVVRRKPQTQQGMFVHGEPPIVPFVPSTLSDVLAGGRLFQGQAKAEPLQSLVAPVPDFGWFVQGPDVVRRKLQTRTGFYVRGEPPIVPFVPSTLNTVSYPGPVVIGQAKAEPLEPIAAAVVPDFGWFVQGPDVVRRKPQTQSGLFVRGADDTELFQDFGWFVQGPDVVRRKHQVRPGMSVRGVDDTEIFQDFDWFVQEPDVVRRKPQTRTGFYVRGYDNIELAPDFDWFSQEPDVVRRKLQTRAGLFSFIREPIEVIVDFDWFVPPADVVRRKLQIQIGLFVRGLDDTEIFQDFGWFVQEPDVIRRKPQTRTGLSVLVEFSIPVPPDVPDIDWNIQEPDVVRRKPQVQLGMFVRGYDDSELFQDFGWFVQGPDVVRRKPQVHPGLFSFVREPIEILVDIDWLVQGSDIIRRPTRPLGLFSRGFDDTELAPDFDWFVAPPDVVRRKPQVHAGLYSFIREPIDFLVDIDWLVQHPGPLPRPVRPEGIFAQVPFVEVPVPDFGWFVPPADVVRTPTRPLGMFVKGLDDVEIFQDFGWFVQQADVVRRKPQTRTGLYVFLLDIVPPVVPDFGWWIQGPDVVRRKLGPLGLHAKPLLILVAPAPDLVFVVRVCLGLPELELNRLLPDPSGFEKPVMVLPDPSGYESDEDTTSALSALADEELPPPSGFIE